ncbi:MAG: NYN domain-containing protein [Clostridium sp.]|uniref:NYN domain-containing protein n=1 Tax=Butyribacter sp. TaxID=2822465 RepID=UPI002A963613|nr:NYN domain-containing protein [Clostridium sp.]MDY5180719.1 NYN domain-containing protein [Butyribacter sp.]
MEKQIAVLIDGDNISAKYAESIKQEALQYGNIKVFRLYGSVNSPNTKRWYPVMPKQGIMPVLQISYASGKSIADQALTIDVMDLLHSDSIDIFCIASSDSDFTKLVYRLKESGKIVIGMGESKTKEALAKACDEFKILNLIYQTEEETLKPDESNVEDAKNDKKPNKNILEKELYEEEFLDDEKEEEIYESEISIPELSEISSYISSYIETLDSERVNLATLGNVLKKRFSGFDARNYKFSNMTQMMRKIDGFRVESENAPDGVHKVVYISLDEKK